tara:strand:- start:2077 stop:2397 length:321 start_codon:yes stop_codon:yes gene_type:complete
MSIEFYEHKEACDGCGATDAWELLGVFENSKGKLEDIIICAFCCHRKRIRSVNIKKKDDSFRFQFGRFSGMTIEEVDEQENGRKYLEYMRDNNEKLSGRIEAYLEA